MIALSLWKGSIVLRQRCVTMREIVERVATEHDLSTADIIGPSRLKPICQARQRAMWEMRQVTWEDGSPRFSTTMIGNYLGRRDHTTVMHGSRRHQERLAKMRVGIAA